MPHEAAAAAAVEGVECIKVRSYGQVEKGNLRHEIFRIEQAGGAIDLSREISTRATFPLYSHHEEDDGDHPHHGTMFSIS